MDTNVAIAATSAAVAAGVTLVVSQLQKAKDAKAQQAEVASAWTAGRQQGYYEGRESLLQGSMENVTPQDFSTR